MKVLVASWRLFMLRPKEAFANVSTQFFFTLTPLLTALLLKAVFDALDGVFMWGLGIWTLVLLLPIAVLLQGLSDIISLITFWICLFKYPILLRKNMLEGVLDQPGAFALEKSPGEAVSRFRGDVSEASDFVAILGFQIALAFYAIIAFALMYSINTEVTIFVFIPFTLVTGAVAVFRNKVTKYRKSRRKAAGKVTGVIGEVFDNVQAIKVASA